jgi:hypothetical protein
MILERSLGSDLYQSLIFQIGIQIEHVSLKLRLRQPIIFMLPVCERS